MSRNFYILAASLGLFALVSAGMSLVPSSFQPGLPANASLWRSAALVMLLFGLGAALVGVLSHLFEQVDRRSEEARRAEASGGMADENARSVVSSLPQKARKDGAPSRAGCPAKKKN